MNDDTDELQNYLFNVKMNIQKQSTDTKQVNTNYPKITLFLNIN